ncbi:PadR family transcriptional regulator [Peribacillus kribbensis]|uniref:PadR family transcriptional regulator n=1 Tax=Peribacillus kribbensis TaxID=356658 RepID=UPI00040F764D|nr:PadR family transcriptional regulator [Peribacillus kribbensis]
MRKTELIKGVSEMILLSFLDIRDMYGYELMETGNRVSDGYFQLKEGSVYPALKRLHEKGFVDLYWKDSKEGPQRKYYTLTEEGRRELNQQKKEWSMFQGALLKTLFHAE